MKRKNPQVYHKAVSWKFWKTLKKNLANLFYISSTRWFFPCSSKVPFFLVKTHATKLWYILCKMNARERPHLWRSFEDCWKQMMTTITMLMQYTTSYNCRNDIALNQIVKTKVKRINNQGSIFKTTTTILATIHTDYQYFESHIEKLSSW